jgi:Holliday junction resolvase-like predicted endonuclease
VHTDKGRIDVVLKKDNRVVIVEIKYSKDNKFEENIKEALAQIKDTKYYEKYSTRNPTLLGIVF